MQGVRTEVQLCRAALEVDSQTEEALVASKVDYLAEEYSQLLLSQLDEQRAYFGTLHEKQAQQAEATLQESKAQCKSLEAAAQSSAAKAQASERRYKAAESKLVGTDAPPVDVSVSSDRIMALCIAWQFNNLQLCILIRSCNPIRREPVLSKSPHCPHRRQ